MNEADIEVRRAAVQLNRMFAKPAYVAPPKRRLDRILDKERHCGPYYEAIIHAERYRPERRGMGG